jgi:hypothetical protein
VSTLSTIAPERIRQLETVSLVEAGRLLGMHKTKTYALVARNAFPVEVREICGRKRVRLVDLEAFIEATFL